MKQAKRFRAALAMVIAVALITGCASTPVGKYQTIGTVKIAVDTGMKAWADRVIDGKATPAQEAQVRAAYNTYRAAAIAYIDVATGDSVATPPDIASAATALLNLLTTFGVKGGGK